MIHIDNQPKFVRKIFQSVTPTVPFTPEGIGGDFRNVTLPSAPITVHNQWPEPEMTRNHHVCQYLWQPLGMQSPFSEFVKAYYHTSCAVVYRDELNASQIIGSGSLIEPTRIVTARHNFNYIPENKLAVRFYNYRVIDHDYNSFCYFADYLEVPVLEVGHPSNGLDLGFIYIQAIAPLIFNQFMQILPSDLNIPNLSTGDYALFHFAWGEHQISIGRIEQINVGAPLHEQLIIQAGPGASGAAAIWSSFGNTQAVAVSIYRNQNGLERRLINLASHLVDFIAAPYRETENFVLRSSDDLAQASPEFIKWSRVGYDEAEARKDKPDNNPIYHVYDNGSCHHIIPIRDLQFIWDYFHSLPKYMEQRIDQEIKILKQQSMKTIRMQLQQYNEELRRDYSNSDPSWIANQVKGYEQQLLLKMYRQLEIEEQQRTEHALKLLYAKFLASIALLCFPNTPVDVYKNDGKKAFAWSYWNLFKGWNCDYRSDDPSKDHIDDRSEKTCPQSFNGNLWGLLKRPTVGLFARIQQLQYASQNANGDEPMVITAQENLYQSLSNLSDFWKNCPKSIHKTKPEDWETFGEKHGHISYRLRR